MKRSLLSLLLVFATVSAQAIPKGVCTLREDRSGRERFWLVVFNGVPVQQFSYWASPSYSPSNADKDEASQKTTKEAAMISVEKLERGGACVFIGNERGRE